MVNFPRQQEDFVSLTDREREVLQCIARGMSSKQCAQELGIAPRTVRPRRKPAQQAACEE